MSRPASVPVGDRRSRRAPDDRKGVTMQRESLPYVAQRIGDVLADAGPLTVREISDRVGVSRRTVRSVLQTMAALRVVRSSQPADGSAPAWRLVRVISPD